LNVNKASKKKRENNTNDEPPSKKAKIELKETKNESPSSMKKSKNESKPKQMLNKTETNLNEIDFECIKTNEEGNKYNLKICTWNVSGIRAVIKVCLLICFISFNSLIH